VGQRAGRLVKMKKYFLTVILIAGLFAADEITVSAVLDKNVVEAGGQLVLLVSVSGPGTPPLKVPQINDFNVYNGGQSTQSSYSMINGRISSSTSVNYNYTLSPKGPGKFTIPSFSVEYKGRTYKSEPLQVEVVKGGVQQKSPAPGGGGNTPVTSGDDIFIQVTVNSHRAYVNEPVIMSFGLYRRMDILGQPQYSAPETTGFWKEDLPPQLNYNKDGYAVTELKTALFPSQQGDFTLGKATLACTIPARGGNDDFFAGFFNNGKNIRLESKPVNITVMPLPAEGKPDNFSGTVGRLNLAVTLDKREVKTNDAVTLTVTLAGSGNIKSIAEPRLLLSDEFKKYETVSEININKDNFEVKGAKIFKTVLVPRKAGKLVIPAVRYSYFDYGEKKYKTLSSNPLTVNVTQGPKEDAGYAGLPSLPAPEGVKVFGSDIRHIKQAGSFTYGKKVFYRSPAYLVLSSVPLLAWLFILLLLKYRSSKEQNRAYFKASRAYSRSQKCLKKVSRDIASGKQAECLGELENIFAEYIGDKINRPAAGLSVAEIRDILAEKIKDRELADLAAGLLEELHFNRFAPAGKEKTDLAGLAAALKEIIIKIEKAGL